jgi:predicted peptidase
MKATMTAVLTVLVAAAASADEGAMAKKYGGQFEKRTYTDSAGKKLLYRLLKPAEYDASSSMAYPLVVFLHGAGERGDDNEAQLVHGAPEFATPEMRKKHPCFVIAPQCPKNQSWAKVDRKAGDLVATLPAEPTEPMRLVLEVMDSISKEFHIDPKRVYITGLSMGGFGTWDILARHPERVTAAVPVCGGGVEDTAQNFAKTPIWVFHGGSDPVVKPELSRRMVEAIRKAGGKPGYSEYPGVGHDSWTITYHNPDVLDWLFAQKKK